MKIESITLLVNDLEKMKNFYCKYFYGISSEKYIDSKTRLESYFIDFRIGPRLEILKTEISADNLEQEIIGMTHIAFKLNSKEKVNQLTKLLSINDYTVLGKPRITGDGYYESVILDPEKNRVELVA